MSKWTSTELSLAYFLSGGSSGTKLFSDDCYKFFTMDRFIFKDSEIWLPWRGMHKETLANSISKITDPSLKDLFQKFDTERSNLYQLNEKWTLLIIKYFDIPVPVKIDEWNNFRKTIDKHRKLNGASWMNLPESKSYAKEMKLIRENINHLKVKIDKQMTIVYGDIFTIDEDFGDQRAKDLIDMTEGIPDSQPEEAIKLLTEALTYGETGIQASKAYLGLGMRYEDLNDIDKAIENYTKSLDANKPFSICLFWRGKLYFQQGKWPEAKSDFKQALELGELVSPEVEQAQDYLKQIQLNEKS